MLTHGKSENSHLRGKKEAENGLGVSGIQGFSENSAGDHHTHCFVRPVVLHEDVLSSVLSSIGEQHYNFIAVGPRDICLLKNTFRWKRGETYQGPAITSLSCRRICDIRLTAG